MATKYQHDVAMHFLGHHRDEMTEDERSSLARIANTYVGPSRYAEFKDYDALKSVIDRVGKTCQHKS